MGRSGIGGRMVIHEQLKPLFETKRDRAICVLAPFTGQWIEVSKILSAPTP